MKADMLTWSGISPYNVDTQTGRWFMLRVAASRRCNKSISVRVAEGKNELNSNKIWMKIVALDVFCWNETCMDDRYVYHSVLDFRLLFVRWSRF